jgi:four helix bundle protein
LSGFPLDENCGEIGFNPKFEEKNMAKVDRFEELNCWKAARELTRLIYALSRSGPIWKDFNMRDQIRSAALSSMSNIAESFRRMSDREFIRFLEISTSSSDEVSSISYAAEDQSYWTEEQASQVRKSAEKVIALNLGLIKYLLSKGKK